MKAEAVVSFLSLLVCSSAAVIEPLPENVPIAIHQLVVVDTAKDSVIRLKSFDANSFDVGYFRRVFRFHAKLIVFFVVVYFQNIYTLGELPSTGSLFQLSQVFSSYGYEPKAGMRVLTSNTNVTGSNNRIYYKRPSPDVPGLDKVRKPVTWRAVPFTIELTITIVFYCSGTVLLSR